MCFLHFTIVSYIKILIGYELGFKNWPPNGWESFEQFLFQTLDQGFFLANFHHLIFFQKKSLKSPCFNTSFKQVAKI